MKSKKVTVEKSSLQELDWGHKMGASRERPNPKSPNVTALTDKVEAVDFSIWETTSIR